MRYKTLVVLAVGLSSLFRSLLRRRTRRLESRSAAASPCPNSEVKDHLGNGYNFNFGVEVNVTPVIGIEGLYSFNGLGEKRISIPVSATPARISRPHRLLRRA